MQYETVDRDPALVALLCVGNSAGACDHQLVDCTDMRPSAKANHDAARQHAESLRDVLEPLRHKTTREIARELNADRFRTAKGGEFSSMQVWRILKRLESRRV